MALLDGLVLIHHSIHGIRALCARPATRRANEARTAITDDSLSHSLSDYEND
jgi:hypothetical protein